MKKIKLTLILLFAGILGQITLSAKEPKTTMELLTAHTWIWEATPAHYESGEFIGWFYILDNKTFSSSVRDIGSKPFNDIMYYYLSDKLEYKFDERKVGKVQNGKYVICANMKNTEILVLYEIVELTDKVLKIKVLNASAGKRGGDNTETFLPYEGKLE